jgi:DNA topoisomerase IB
LLYRHALRAGNPNNETSGQKTFALTTLQVRHVKVSPQVIDIKYPGKAAYKKYKPKSGKTGKQKTDKIAYLPQKHEIDIPSDNSPEAKIRQMLAERLKKLLENKAPTDSVFQVGKNILDAYQLNSYIKTKLKLPMTAKDFRTFKGTRMMKSYIKNHPLKKGASPKEAEEWFKKGAMLVGRALGHQKTGKEGQPEFVANTALQNYIDPSIGLDIWERLGYKVPNFLEKFAEDEDDKE